MKKILTLMILCSLLMPELSAAAIIGKPSNNLGLVGYWPMSEGFGISTRDISGRGSVGSINGNGATTTIFLTAGSSWTVPADWNASANAIEVIGGGGGANGGAAGGSGGGGGAYAAIYNQSLTPGASISYSVGGGGNGINGVTANSGTDSYFNGASCAAATVCAKAGVGGNGTGGGAGGAATTSIGTKIFSGGKGGVGASFNQAGGGGAAGSSGNGVDGGTGASGGAGGAGDNSVGGAATAANSGATGNPGSEWDGSHGSGGGGAGTNTNSTAGGGGGNYGGGAGAGKGASGGNGGPGIIVISYRPTTASWITGRFGSALNFDGSSNYVNMGDIGAMDGLAAVTVSAWVKSAASGTNFANETHFVDKSDCSGTSGTGPFELYKGSGGGTAQFTVDITGGFRFSGAGTTNIDDGQWHLVTGRYDGSSISIWVDGRKESENNAVSGALSNTAKSFIVGGYCNNQLLMWNGAIDEVRVYNRALSATEIRNSYTSGSAISGASSARLGSGALSSGLVGHWTFDGADVSDKVYDRSGKANNGYWYGSGATSSAKTLGKIGQALNFTQANGNRVYLGSPASLDSLSAVTVSAWIKPNGNDGEIFSKATDGSTSLTGPDLWISGGTDLYYSRTFNTNFAGGHAVNAISLNKWQHVVVTHDGDGSHNPIFYVDGVLQATASDGTGSGGIYDDSAVSAVIGNYGSDVNQGAFFPGQIDDVRVYNRPLSANEVKQLYNLGSQKINSSSAVTAGVSSLTNGLVGHWTFDGADVTDKVYDKSGNGRHGYMVGKATTSAKVLGKLGQAFSFDGQNGASPNFVDVGVVDIPGAITLSAWIKPNAATFSDCSSGCELIANYNSGADHAQYDFYILGNNLGYGSATVPVVGDSNDTTGSPITEVNKWYHVVVTRNDTGGTRVGDTVEFYVDGVVQPKTSSPGKPPTSGFGRAAIGRDGDISSALYYFPGAIDDVRMYNRQLTAAEVKQLYNLGK